MGDDKHERQVLWVPVQCDILLRQLGSWLTVSYRSACSSPWLAAGYRPAAVAYSGLRAFSISRQAGAAAVGVDSTVVVEVIAVKVSEGASRRCSKEEQE